MEECKIRRIAPGELFLCSVCFDFSYNINKMKSSKYIIAYSLIGLYVLVQIGIGVYVGLTTKYCVGPTIAYILFACNMCSLGLLPGAVVQGSFSFGSWVWARQHGLTCCVHVKRPTAPSSARSASVIVARLAEYGRKTFGKSEEHVRGYCLNMVGSEIYGMAMRTRSYSIGNYYKNYDGDDFGCSRKTWGAVRDIRGRSICYWDSPSGPIYIKSGTDVDDILMEMDIVLGERQEVESEESTSRYDILDIA